MKNVNVGQIENVHFLKLNRKPFGHIVFHDLYIQTVNL